MPLQDIVINHDGTTDVRVPRGGDLIFAVEWIEHVSGGDDEDVAIVSADGAIRDNITDTVRLDLSPYITINGGKADINVPASVTKALVPWGQGYWTITGTSADGRTLILVEGTAELRRGAERD